MNRQKLKNTDNKFLTVIFLCIGALFLSAFTVNPQSDYMTRLEMASLMEEILNEAGINADSEDMPTFSDLSQQEKSSIQNVLKFKIMDGFVDNSFRPSAPMRNLEVISYLQKLTELVRKINPECLQAKMLFRFLSYNEDHSFAFEYDSLNLPFGLRNPNDKTAKSITRELYNTLTNNVSQYVIISGQIISSIDEKPISTAFISVNREATDVDANGQFQIELSKDVQIADIFAEAEGYQPTEIRKDLKFGSNMTIRLRPGQ